MGDNDYEQFGLSHLPDFNKKSDKTSANTRVFYISACDGLTEKLSKEQLEKLIESIFYTNPEITVELLTKKLAEEALKQGADDNISIVATEVKKGDPLFKFMAVFDGHRGDKVSEALFQLFTAVLKNKILLSLMEKQHPEKYKSINKMVASLLKKQHKEIDILATKDILNALNHMSSNSDPGLTDLLKALDIVMTMTETVSEKTKKELIIQKVNDINSSLLNLLKDYPKTSAVEILGKISSLLNEKSNKSTPTKVFGTSSQELINKAAEKVEKIYNNIHKSQKTQKKQKPQSG